MTFNHYAKIKRILEAQSTDWYIRRIDEPTKAKNFKGEITTFSHYYRVYSADGQAIKYCKFQQLSRLARIIGVHEDELPIV